MFASPEGVLRAVLVRLDSKGVHPGKKKLQKLIYLLNASGFSSGYWFGIHLYGPYSADLSQDVTMMIQDGELEISPEGMTGELRVTKDFRRDGLPEMDSSACKLLDQFSKLSAYELELISTLHFLHTENGLSTGDLEVALSNLKPKYQQAEVASAVVSLTRHGLIA